MNLKTSSLIALLALTAAPLAATAGDLTSDAAFDACIKAFSAARIENHPVRATHTKASFQSATLDYWKPDRYTIDVRARGVNSGKVLAEGRCVVDRNGVALIQDTAQAVVTTKEL